MSRAAQAAHSRGPDFSPTRLISSLVHCDDGRRIDGNKTQGPSRLGNSRSQAHANSGKTLAPFGITDNHTPNRVSTWWNALNPNRTFDIHRIGQENRARRNVQLTNHRLADGRRFIGLFAFVPVPHATFPYALATLRQNAPISALLRSTKRRGAPLIRPAMLLANRAGLVPPQSNRAGEPDPDRGWP